MMQYNSCIALQGMLRDRWFCKAVSNVFTHIFRTLLQSIWTPTKQVNKAKARARAIGLGAKTRLRLELGLELGLGAKTID